MNISSFVLGSAGSYTTAASINSLADSAAAANAWCVYLIHSIDINDDYSPLSSTVLQASVNYMSTNQDKFWVETFGNVVRYIQERNASSVTETANTGSSITIQVTNNLTNPINVTNTIYNYPITIRRPLPTNWLWATVAQNGAPVPTQVVTNNSTNYVMFDVVPNGGDVTIALTNPPGSLQLVIPATATEGDGVLAGQGSITVNFAPSSDWVVNLTSSNTNKVTVPSSVVIPAGQTNAVFDLTIINDMLLDGDQNVIITAVATNYGAGQAAILVYNTNAATLTVTLPATATKGAGTLTNAGLVSASSVVAGNYSVNLVSSDTSTLSVPASVVIPAGQSSVPFNLTVLSNTLNAPEVVSVTAHVSDWTDGSASMTIYPPGSLQLVIPATATEGEGVLAGQGSITVNFAPSSNWVVNLTSSNTNKVTVPSSVVIPAGQTNAVFDLTIINDMLLDGDQNVTITAVATVYGTAQAAILVYNTNTATLTVTLPATATKGAETLTNAGLVSASSIVATNYSVNLVSSDTSKLTVPSSVVISAGQSSVPFNLTVLDNTLIDGPQVVTVTAHVSGWTDGSNSMTILDYHAPPDHFVWSVVPSPQIVGQPFNVTITAYDTNNNQVMNYMQPVNLNAWAPGTAPATNDLLSSPSGDPYSYSGEYVLGYSFTPSTNLVVTAVRSYFGDKVSLWTDNGMLLASQNVVSVPGTWVETPLTNAVVLLASVTYRVGIHINNATLYWNDNLPATFPDGTINESWSAAGDTFPNSLDSGLYLVDLRYGTNVESVPISPAMSGNFNYGTWFGNLAVLQPAASVTLQSSIPGCSGQSLPFNVLWALSITPAGKSVAISWPVAATNFILEETHDLAAGPWAAVTNAPAVVDNNYILTNTPTATNTFYRLHQQP
jgi:hypothetical protein